MTLVKSSNQAASTGKGKGLVHSKHRVRTKAALTVNIGNESRSETIVGHPRHRVQVFSHNQRRGNRTRACSSCSWSRSRLYERRMIGSPSTGAIWTSSCLTVPSTSLIASVSIRLNAVDKASATVALDATTVTLA